MKKISPILQITLTGVFAALIYLIMMFRIPFIAAIGAPFIHVGNAAVVLAILLLGFRNGMLAGAIGLGLFDLLNGYATVAPYTIAEVVIVAIVVTGTFKLFKYQDKPIYKMFIISFLAGFIKIISSFIENILISLWAGASFNVAAVNSFLSLPATAINSIVTFILVPLLYYPLKKIMRRSLH